MNKQLFENVIERMTTSLDKNGNHLNMNSIMVSDDCNTFTYYFTEREKIDLRSISKPILCLAVGAAIENGLEFNGEKIALETPVWKYLSKYATINNDEQKAKWKKIKLIDLLRITFGHEKGIMFSKDVREHNEDELINYIVNYPIKYESGQHFVYSNAGGYLISSLITEYCGVSADEFVDYYIFSKLGIEDFTWKKYGKYCAGCTGLKMFNEDLHKIAKLILNNGYFENQSIVPVSWIEEMKKPQVQTPTHRYIHDRAFPKWSYGLNLWICEDGNYYCDGSDGQYLIIIPKKRIAVTTLGYQTDTLPVSEALGLFK